MILYSDYVNALDYVRKEWGDAVIVYICMADKTPMNFDQFLNHCTACGGNWGGMLLKVSASCGLKSGTLSPMTWGTMLLLLSVIC